jgi:hypothetical protein
MFAVFNSITAHAIMLECMCHQQLTHTWNILIHVIAILAAAKAQATETVFKQQPK